MSSQRRLDLTGLDAEAAHLHLLVDAPEEVQIARGQPTYPVSGAVEPGSRLAAEGVRHEPLGRKVRPAQIGASQQTTEHQLARHTGRHRATVPVQDVGSPARQWPADGHRGQGGAGRSLIQSRRDDGLGRAVAVDQPRLSQGR